MDFLHPLIPHLRHAILTGAHALGGWSYVLLGFCVMVEGPGATLLGAAAASAGILQLPLVFVAAATGNLMGDVLWYSLGRRVSVEWIKRHGRWFGLKPAQMTEMERSLRDNAARIIFVAKITLFLAVPALVSAGVLRIRLRRWLPVDMIAECLWTGSLVLVGYYMSLTIARLERGMQMIATAGTVLVILAALALLRRSHRRQEDSATVALDTGSGAGRTESDANRTRNAELFPTE